jgi:hypothetical protein
MDEVFRNSMWTSSANGMQSHALLMGRMCRPEFAQLIKKIANRFSSQPLPSSEDEFQQRQMQSIACSSTMGSIAHADSMARNTNSVQQIYDEALRLSEIPIPNNEAERQRLWTEQMTFISRISSICHSDATARFG